MLLKLNPAAAHSESKAVVLVHRYLSSQRSKIAAVAFRHSRETGFALSFGNRHAWSEAAIVPGILLTHNLQAILSPI
jgi:hypothetical protein